MKSPIPTRGALLSFFGALAVAALLAVPTARAQPRQIPEPAKPQPILIPGGGTELFRALLDKEGIEPATQNESRFGEPDANTIVIVIGSTPGGDWDEGLRWARRTIRVGGAALLATDSFANVYEWDRNPGNNNPVGWFNGASVTADWANPDHTYNRMPSCPFVVPISPNELPDAPARPGRVWGVFRGLTRITTNDPTCFEPARFREEYQYPLARFPKSARINGGRPNTPPLFAIGGDGPERFNSPGYSFLAMADSSVFINQMLMETSTDNLELTLRTIEYLQGPDKKQPRKKCLFYENGRVIEKFDGLAEAVRPPRPKLPPEQMPNIGPLFGKHQDKLVNFLDQKADELQEKDFFHRSFVGPQGSERERKSAANWIEIALVIAAIIVVLLLLMRLWKARHPQDVPPPPNTGGGVASSGPPGVFDRRQKELVRRNNVYEPVQHLLRQFFDSAGAPANPGPRTPKLVITSAVRKPDSLRNAINDLWRLAYGPPTLMSAQRWFELEPYFERLRQAHADGKWRFVTDGA